MLLKREFYLWMRTGDSEDMLSLDADGTSGLPFGTQTGQRSGELTANSG